MCVDTCLIEEMAVKFSHPGTLSLTDLLNSGTHLFAFFLIHNSQDKEGLLLVCLAPRLNETFVRTYIVRLDT